MNTTTASFRSIVAAVAALALTLAACGGDDDSAATPTTVPSENTVGSEPATEPASITFDAQTSDGSTITVAAVDLPSPGFIAVHSDGGGSPGPVIGTSGLLPVGASTDVVVTLDTPLAADTTLYPMVHIDTNSNGVYEFGTVDGVDTPGVTAAGEVAVAGAAVTIAGDEGAAPEGDNTITIANFAFSGVTEVPVGTTVVVTNTDATTHTWSSADGTFDSGALAPDETFEFTFTEPGSFDYVCNFHPSMQGTIVVTG